MFHHRRAPLLSGLNIPQQGTRENSRNRANRVSATTTRDDLIDVHTCSYGPKILPPRFRCSRVRAEPRSVCLAGVVVNGNHRAPRAEERLCRSWSLRRPPVHSQMTMRRSKNTFHESNQTPRSPFKDSSQQPLETGQPPARRCGGFSLGRRLGLLARWRSWRNGRMIQRSGMQRPSSHPQRASRRLPIARDLIASRIRKRGNAGKYSTRRSCAPTNSRDGNGGLVHRTNSNRCTCKRGISKFATSQDLSGQDLIAPMASTS